jgi:hypothetical protein
MKFLLTSLLLAIIATASFAQSAAPSPSPAASPAASPAKHHHKKADQTAITASPSPVASPVTATTIKTPAPAKKTPPGAFVPPANAAPGGGNGWVWVNTSSKAYHKEGSKWYGKTKHGKYISEPDALKEGDHAAKD